MTRRASWAVALGLATLVVAACGDEGGGDAADQGSGDTTPSGSLSSNDTTGGTTGATTGGTTGGETTDPNAVTFWRDVAPILDASCTSCHQAGGIAPFTFDTYDEVKTWGPAIVAATHARTMPPWLVVGDGSCGDYADNEWLSDETLQTLKDWVDQGMIEGVEQERSLPGVRQLDAISQMISTPDFSPVREGSDFAEFDEYRCFPVEVNIDSPTYLTGYDVFPGNEAIVHHVIGNIVRPGAASRRNGKTNAERMAELDAESPDRAGWPCYSQAGSGVSIDSDPIGWAPGQGAVSFPEGTGIPVEPGSVIVLQVHYNLYNDADQGSSDVTDVALQFSDEVDTVLYPLYLDLLLGYGDELEPGQSAYEYRRSVSLADLEVPVNVNLWGIMPHMHERGTQLNVTLRSPLGSDEPDRCVTQVNDWDFAWQRVYWYNEPILIRPTDTWEMTCTYDTTGTDEPVLAGWGTKNEMCLTVLYASIAL